MAALLASVSCSSQGTAQSHTQTPPLHAGPAGLQSDHFAVIVTFNNIRQEPVYEQLSWEIQKVLDYIE